MQTVVPKPKRGGRPATGRDPLVQLRMPADLIQAIDRFADKFADLSRSQAIRALIDIGLHAGRKRNEVTDPKRYRGYVRKVPLAKRRRPPPAASAPVLRIVGKE
jgi:hypothetical protein